MRHAFRFPEHIRKALKNHIEKAVSEIDMRRFHQEAPYTDALAAKLQGVVYDQNDGYVKIDSTVVNERGRGAAEKWSGADLVITASISDKIHKKAGGQACKYAFSRSKSSSVIHKKVGPLQMWNADCAMRNSKY